MRGHKALLDEQLAALYGIETKILTRAVRRNIDRFPDDFMFQLSEEEFDLLRRQFGTSSVWGGRRYRPLVFTEQGVAMLSSVLRSKKAVEINIQIMRAFVRLRQLLSIHKELANRLTQLENQTKLSDALKTDRSFQKIHAEIKKALKTKERVTLRSSLGVPLSIFRVEISVNGPMKCVWRMSLGCGPNSKPCFTVKALPGLWQSRIF